MDAPALWMLSLSAFGAVMALLGLLAAALGLLTALYPAPPPAPAPLPAAGRPAEVDHAVFLAAIQAAAAQRWPGAQVQHVEALAGSAVPGNERAAGESAREER